MQVQVWEGSHPKYFCSFNACVMCYSNLGNLEGGCNRQVYGARRVGVSEGSGTG